MARSRVPPQRKIAPKQLPSYAQTRRKLRAGRLRLARRYLAARGQQARRRILRQAAAWLVRQFVTRLFPHWYTTRWDFNGTTNRPRQGAISCGVFVSTLLVHAGFRVPRLGLGVLDATDAIRSLTTWRYMKGTWRWSIGRFVRWLRRQGDGLYVVGLDCHIGFLVVQGRRVEFVHANYAHPRRVLREPARTSPVLSASRVRLVGAISRDPRLILRWLLGGSFRIRRQKPRPRLPSTIPMPKF